MRLLDALTVDRDPASYEDCYRKRLETIVRRRQQGKTIKAPTRQDQPSPTPDLMAALRKKLYERAQEAGIPGRSSMTKKQLAGALDRKD